MKVAIIGCGLMGALHARCAKACGLEIAVCYDPIRANAARLGKTHKARIARDPKGAIAADDVDLVVIASPTPFHAEQTIAAAKAGKHVFCEKPFARSTADARKAAAAIRKAGVHAFVGHVVRYFHEFETIKAKVDGGAIGKVGWVKTYRGGICPTGAKNWFRDYAQSGGAAFDMLIHDFDWIRYNFGPVKRVFCQALMRQKPTPMDYVLVTLALESGVLAQCVGSWAHATGFRVKAELCGDQGMIQFDSADAPIHTTTRPGAETVGGMLPSSPVNSSPYQKEWDDFAALLRDGRKTRLTIDDAVEAVRIAEAAERSARTGKAIVL